MLFTFPLRYWFAIGFPRVFRLAGWCRPLQTGFLRPRLTQDTAQPQEVFAYGTFTLYGVPFQKLQLTSLGLLAVLQPRRARSPVWPLPLSLATTDGITVVFFSSAYLDVSVRQVRHSCFHAFSMEGCPIRTSTDLWLFAPPRCFSQLTTSFVACGNLGIPRAPLVRFQLFSLSDRAFANTCSLAPHTRQPARLHRRPPPNAPLRFTYLQPCQ